MRTLLEQMTITSGPSGPQAQRIILGRDDKLQSYIVAIETSDGWILKAVADVRDAAATWLDAISILGDENSEMREKHFRYLVRP